MGNSAMYAPEIHLAISNKIPNSLNPTIVITLLVKKHTLLALLHTDLFN